MSWAADGLPSAPKLKAKSYLLVDFHSGVELAEKNADSRIEPASITKLMTAYVIYKELAKGNITLEDKVLISNKAWKMEGSRMFVEAGKKVPLNRMLHGLIIQSGNDAAVALAEHISGSEASFVAKMNAESKKMGLNSTSYMNATGWPAENHYTSARDIVTLTRAIINEFPEKYKLHSIKEYSYNGIKQYNRNKLLWRDKTVDGVKTGHTESAGYCLVASAQRNDMRLISVVLVQRMKKLVQIIAKNYLSLAFVYLKHINSMIVVQYWLMHVSGKVPKIQFQQELWKTSMLLFKKVTTSSSRV
jgi:D-alanyl-D-alanine carboxypeptidase (penicillin-binding protein 5/6)